MSTPETRGNESDREIEREWERSDRYIEKR